MGVHWGWIVAMGGIWRSMNGGYLDDLVYGKCVCEFT